VPEQVALAERLVEHTFADTVFFCNSGTEACGACHQDGA
jgi:acetylornithine/N-succinyldiaminopimelate aminotransferase